MQIEGIGFEGLHTSPVYRYKSSVFIHTRSYASGKLDVNLDVKLLARGCARPALTASDYNADHANVDVGRDLLCVVLLLILGRFEVGLRCYLSCCGLRSSVWLSGYGSFGSPNRRR